MNLAVWTTVEVTFRTAARTVIVVPEKYRLVFAVALRALQVQCSFDNKGVNRMKLALLVFSPNKRYSTSSFAVLDNDFAHHLPILPLESCWFAEVQPILRFYSHCLSPNLKTARATVYTCCLFSLFHTAMTMTNFSAYVRWP